MAKLAVDGNDFVTLKDALKGKPERKIGHNTTLRYDHFDTVVAVRLHWTDIVKVYPTNAVELRTGGYHTVTTKERINQFLPPGVAVVQRRGEWFVESRRTDQRVPFFEGITVRDDGQVQPWA